MLTAIIIDDESSSRNALKQKLANYCPQVQVIAECEDGEEGIKNIEDKKPDIIFLDVEMPWMNGFEMLEVLDTIDFHIIFTTAHDQFAAKAFRISAVDYLLKPISFERFLKAVTKALHSIQSVKKSEIEKVPSAEQALFVKANNRIMKIFLPDILFIEGLKEYITIHTSATKIITLQSMKKMEEILPYSNFLRVHKSFIVAIDKIDSIERNRIYIRKDTIPIGETYKEQFLSAINKQNLL